MSTLEERIEQIKTQFIGKTGLRVRIRYLVARPCRTMQPCESSSRRGIQPWMLMLFWPASMPWRPSWLMKT